MEIHVYTEYDPSKALVFFILAGHRVKPARKGFVTEISDEEWTALKIVAKAKPSWRTLVRTGIIEEPTAKNILSSLLIEKVIQ